MRVGSAAVLATCGALITDAKGLLQAAAMQLALAGSSTIHEQVLSPPTRPPHLVLPRG